MPAKQLSFTQAHQDQIMAISEVQEHMKHENQVTPRKSDQFV